MREMMKYNATEEVEQELCELADKEDGVNLFKYCGVPITELSKKALLGCIIELGRERELFQ